MRFLTIVCPVMLALTAHLSSAAQGGEIYFYKKDNCREQIGKISSSAYTDANLSNRSTVASNDDIRSLKLVNVDPGTVLELWDHSSVRGKDDWCRITVNTGGSTFVINNIENAPSYGAKLTYKRYPRDKDVGKGKYGNLAGKVSHVLVTPDPTVLKLNDAITKKRTWDKKDGRAYELRSLDSNYRVWKPTLTVTASGVTAVIKVDHIRGAAQDDHAIIGLDFDKGGVLQNLRTQLEFAGKNPIVKVMEARDAMTERTAAAIPDPKLQAGAYALAAVGNMQTAVFEAVEEAAESGGRMNLREVIKTEAANVSKWVAEAIDAANLK